MLGLLTLVLSSAAVLIGYTQARAFVRERLRYVDAAQSGLAPVVGGIGAFAVGAVVTGLLPLVGTGTALAFGVAVAMGVSNGQKDIRGALPPGI